MPFTGNTMTNKQANETEQQRLKALLKSAFAGPPTPLKDIPKKDGESRAAGTVKRKKSKRARPVRP